MNNGNIIRKHKQDNFTIVDNAILKNKELSLKAKGLLVMLLSLPDDWEFSESGLTALSKDGRDGVRSGLKELEKFGYLKRERERSDNGVLGKTVYHVYETPMSDLPMLEKPMLEKPILVNPHNKVLNNKELNNKELIYTHFDIFWEKYPRKAAVQRARTTFKNRVKDKDTLDAILKDLDKRKNFEPWLKDNGKFIPHPTTYLNGGMWEDEYDVSEKKVKTNQAIGSFI